MGFWDFLKRPVPMSVFTPNVTHVGSVDEISAVISGMTASELWRTQPHLRTVVSFLARNVAQLGVHTFVRDGEDRQRDRTSPLAVALGDPGDDMTTYDLIFALVGDLALYDRAYWVLWEDDGKPRLRRLPPSWVTPDRESPFKIKAFEVKYGEKSVRVPASDVLNFTGYSPNSHSTGSPTVEALKGTIEEQIEATRYRAQVWKRGGRVSAVLERPKDAPPWSDGAREAFREDWYSKYTGKGSRAGGTPLLEDGMSLKRIDFSAQEQQFVEATKLSLQTVAAAYHINPTMVGQLDNANYSNVREFRRMLYGDSLGPLLAQIEARINTFLIPMLEMDRATSYAEFNIAEKLKGSFEEQAAVMQTLVGAPLFTRNEGRSMFNKPEIEGGDQLVTPLNVLIGGQASPTDSGSQNLDPKSQTGPLHKAALKAIATENQRDKVAEVLTGFFRRQGKVVLSRIGAGEEWWDGERWDRELTEDLLKVTHTLAALLGPVEAKRLGYEDGYDPDRTVEFLTAVAERRASNINETTKAQVGEQVESDDPDPAHVFSVAEESRATGVAASVAQFAAAFATVEAARQVAYDQGMEATKTWVTGDNPRDAHAAMNGETVPIDQPFSNGQEWPGSAGDVDDVAGCNCSVQTNTQEA